MLAWYDCSKWIETLKFSLKIIVFSHSQNMPFSAENEPFLCAKIHIVNIDMLLRFSMLFNSLIYQHMMSIHESHVFDLQVIYIYIYIYIYLVCTIEKSFNK